MVKSLKAASQYAIVLVFAAVLLPQSSIAQFSLTMAPDKLSGYDRKLFKHWIDQDGDGCNTRLEVLIEEAIKTPKVGKNCSLSGGVWKSPYDDKIYTNPSKLDIDHLVPLAEAWRSGAWRWTAKQRESFANDLQEPNSLIAVSLNLNRSKGDQDLSGWTPPKGKCSYLKAWITVKTKYSLTVDLIESRVLSSLAKTCSIELFLIDSSDNSMQSIPNATQDPNSNSGTVSSTVPKVEVSPASSATSSMRIVSPGAFCSKSEAGMQGTSAKGVTYTCKISDSENRLRWRR